MTTHRATARPRTPLTKVPGITAWFWIIKVLCTTVGETAADFLNVDLNLGLTGTSVVTGLLLVIALAAQFRADRYRAGRYWTAVTMVSVFGTLVTDNLTDALGVPLEASTLLFGALLAVTFLAWYRTEGTLSIHSVRTMRREAFYWLAVLVTFALGTATGDLMAEVLGLGYAVTGLIVAALIAVTAVGWRTGLHPVLAFWIIYVLTRPLGASIGDYLSQPASGGGLNLGPTVTSAIFLLAILGIVVHLGMSKADVIAGPDGDPVEVRGPGGLWQTVAVVTFVVVAGGTGYVLRTADLRDSATEPVPATAQAPAAAGGAVPARPSSPLGDLSAFRVITQDTLNLVGSGDQAGAAARVTDLEVAWDDAEARLRARDGAAWTAIDGRIDKVLRQLRAAGPDPAGEQAALTALLGALGS